MPETARRLASAFAVVVAALVLTSVSGAAAHADDPQPILPLPPFMTHPPTPTTKPTTKPTSTPAKPAATQHKQASTSKKKSTRHHTSTPSRSETTTSTSSSVVAAPTTSATQGTTTSSGQQPRQRKAQQVAAPNFAARTPVTSTATAPQAAPSASTELVSSNTGRALPLWVPVGLLGFLVVLTAGTLGYRRRTGGV